MTDPKPKAPPYVMIRGLSDDSIAKLKHIAIDKKTSVNKLMKRVVETLLAQVEHKS